MDPEPGRSEGVIELRVQPAPPDAGSTWERFEALYRDARDDVYAYVATLLRDPTAAEDVTALAFERAYRRRATFDRRRGVERAWPFGIARNAALDELRRRRRTAALAADPEDVDSGSVADGAPAAAMAGVVVMIVVLVTVIGGGGSRSGMATSSSSAAGASAAATPPSKRNGIHLRSPAHPKSAPAPVPGNPLGCRIMQGAQLSLSTRPGRIDALSQQVFGVIGDEKGYVARSSVTATGRPDSSATFALSVPSSNLQETLTRLSQLPHASVVTSRDITGAVGGAGRRLAEARALRRSLLRQLASAYTTDQINALKARIAHVDRTIDRDRAALTTLHRQVRYSRIELTLEGSAPPPAGHGHQGGGGFTLGRAGHDAVHVLVIAAGVLLIALAVAVPVGLVAAFVSWVWLRARRKAREAALDRA